MFRSITRKCSCLLIKISSLKQARHFTQDYLTLFPAHRVVANDVQNTATCKTLTLDKLISSRQPAYKAVVFDKDGTLICLHSMWVPWAKTVATNICTAVDQDMFEEIFSVLGICSKTFRINPGLLAEGTNAQMAEALNTLLIDRGVEASRARQATDRYVNHPVYDPNNLSQIHNLKDLFTVLRQHDIRVGICTSDNRASTMATLMQLDILHLVDIVMCGDDADGQPKPNPHNASMICERLEVKPEETVMVGDSATDMQFAKNGRFGLAVGVLSGTAGREQLEKAWSQCHPTSSESDLKTGLQIIPSVADIIPIILPDRTIPVRITEGLPRRSKCKLIILDKNGTLTNIYPRWSRWAEELARRLEQQSSTEIAHEFLKVLGYSLTTRRAVGGLLAESSMLHIRESMGYLLLLNGYGMKESEEIVDKVWFTSGLDTSDVLPGVVNTIKQLRASGVKLALNTSDTRDACEQFLSGAGLEGQFCTTLCAEDAGLHPKPLPHTVYKILEESKCQPNDVLVVGDCPADLLSGRAAKCAITVGILSGFSMAHNLLPHADLLTPNVTYLPKLVERLQSH